MPIHTFARGIIEGIRRVPPYLFILGAILILGIFLRTYEFRDFLTFNPDQARDAQIMEDVLSGKRDVPLLGPQSGNTKFSLGPIFYYFGIISGKIFGALPEVFAYPDVLFSILSLPLFFFFLRKYFSLRISLLLVLLLAVSYFALRYGRFAWNTNSIPFFSILFLYGALGMMNEKNRNALRWPVFVGIGLGILIQLHTVLLLTLPLISFLVLIYLWNKKLLRLKSLALIFGIVMLLNSGQIMSEIQTGGANTSALFGGVSDQSGSDANRVRNTLFISACQIQSNIHILSSLFMGERCGRGSFFSQSDFLQNTSLRDQFLADTVAVTQVCLSILFSIGGYILLIRKIRTEKDEEKRKFLSLIFIFNILVLLVLIPVASEITIRYFIMLLIVPFVLLGLWMEWIEEKIRYGKMITTSLVIVLVGWNMYTNLTTARTLMSHSANNADNGVLREIETLADFLLSIERPSRTLYMTGNAKYEKRYHQPLEYIVEKQGLRLAEIRKKTRIPSGATIVYITGKDKKQLTIGEEIDDALVLSRHDFNDVVIYILREF